ncbi:OmpA family protein [Shewanella sp. NIFS-20-20]|uniref:OmpA family protein n=1 Tax=Shewanella sp. NIFS-20-20 TaxID=2853806 RepID=UPI001C4808BA|nr:OmpA family protein [Shewanella sp. NIFS-20-20]MBV7314194.1 OmpA family protein [Shewanella sp. NIFS-20-20]
MKHLSKYVLVAACIPFAASAAQELTPWYLGAGLGVNNYEPVCDLKTMKTCHDENPYAWDVFAGYMLNDYFGVELGYRNLGRTQWTDYSNKLNDVGAKGMTLGLVGVWPFANDWSLSAEVGAMDYILSNNKQWGTEYYSDRGVGSYFGAGIGYNFTENLKLQAKYRRYENLDDDKWNTLDLESNYWGLELSYRFGREVAVPAPVAVILDSDNDGVPDNIDACPDTPAGYLVDANGCTVMVESVQELAIDAKFANNSAVLDQTSYDEVSVLAQFMNQHPESSVVIKGFASNVGNADYNMTLSQKRAEAVAKVLEEKYGIAANRISAKGYGITQPLIAGSSAEANAANRRIEAHVTVVEVGPAMR